MGQVSDIPMSNNVVSYLQFRLGILYLLISVAIDSSALKVIYQARIEVEGIICMPSYTVRYNKLLAELGSITNIV